MAVGDLHVEHAENQEIVRSLRPESDDDWLIVCGDVADHPEKVEWALRLLCERFAKVLWVPGNHELHCRSDAPEELRGERRYRRLVEICHSVGAVTPEDPYPVWRGASGPVRVAPLFLLYDYSFGSNVGATREDALRRAYEAGVVCSDEFLLDPEPYPSRQAWCAERVRETERRLCDEDDLPTVLVNHFPLLSEPTLMLRHPEFAQWCGTVRTADWHLRFRAVAVVYGHLHIPRTTWHAGVRFEEVSLGYPRERRYRSSSYAPRRILPEAPRV